MTLDEFRAYDRPTIGAEPAFKVLGWGRTSAREAIRRGNFVLKPIYLGRKIVFSTVELRRLLGLEPAGEGPGR